MSKRGSLQCKIRGLTPAAMGTTADVTAMNARGCNLSMSSTGRLSYLPAISSWKKDVHTYYWRAELW